MKPCKLCGADISDRPYAFLPESVYNDVMKEHGEAATYVSCQCGLQIWDFEPGTYEAKKNRLIKRWDSLWN